MFTFDAYLASPYSHPELTTKMNRFQKVCEIAAWYFTKGIHIYSPIAHTHPICYFGGLPPQFDFYEKYDRRIIANCAELHLCLIDGWQTSKGMMAEATYAVELNKPIKIFDDDWCVKDCSDEWLASWLS
jgi:hypothetical protein